MASYRLFHIIRVLATYMEPPGPLAEILNREPLPPISATGSSYHREWTGQNGVMTYSEQISAGLRTAQSPQKGLQPGGAFCAKAGVCLSEGLGQTPTVLQAELYAIEICSREMMNKNPLRPLFVPSLQVALCQTRSWTDMKSLTLLENPTELP